MSEGDLTLAWCGFCQDETEQVYVSSHYQCLRCQQVVLGCCEGEAGRDADLDGIDLTGRTDW